MLTTLPKVRGYLSTRTLAWVSVYLSTCLLDRLFDKLKDYKGIFPCFHLSFILKSLSVPSDSSREKKN